MKVLSYPKDSNPYFELLYKEMHRKKGVIVTYLGTNFVNSQTLGLFLLPIDIIKYRLKNYKIFHLHFLYPFGFPNNSKLFHNFLTRTFFSIYFMFFLKFIKLLNFKLVWTAHEVIPIEKEAMDGVWARRFLSNTCDAIIVHAKTSIEEMQKLGMNTKNIYLNPIGSYDGIYENSISKESARKYLKLNKEDFVFLFFGNIEPYKGVEELLEAFVKLPKESKNTKLLIAGKCSNRDLKMKLFEYKKVLKESVKFDTEFIENNKVQYYFNCADIAVFPFRVITTSSTVILALSFGVPVICPKIGNLKELPDNLGFFYNPESGEALLNCMEKAILNKEKLRKMGENAFDYTNNFSWDKIAEKTYDIYKNLENKKH